MSGKMLAVVVLGAAALMVQYFWPSSVSDNPETLIEILKMAHAPHDEGPTEGIHNLTSDLYVATGYGSATVTMVIGSDGVIIINTGDSVSTGARILKQFRKVTSKPVKGIIHTSFHTEVTDGGQGLVEGGQHTPEVWTHRNSVKEREFWLNARPSYLHRAAYLQGRYLHDKGSPADQTANKKLNNRTPGQLSPTRFVEGEEEIITISGVSLTLLHIPGKNSDQLAVWYPKHKILVAPADLLQNFPSQYLLGGAPLMEAAVWAKSLQSMMALKPKCLVTGHSAPICDEETIADMLKVSIASVTFILHQTLRHIDKGSHQKEIRVRLPSDLASRSGLSQNDVDRAVRSVYAQYIGWFSGYPEEIDTLTPTEKANNLVELAGVRQLLTAATEAIQAEEYVWAFELASYVHSYDSTNQQAVNLRRVAMVKLAENETSVAERNMLLTAIMSDAGLAPKQPDPGFVNDLSIEEILNNLRYKLDAAKANWIDLPMCFYFTDTDTRYCVRLYHSLLDTFSNLEQFGWIFKVNITETAFRAIISGDVTTEEAEAKGMLSSEGGLESLNTFLGYFELEK